MDEAVWYITYAASPETSSPGSCILYLCPILFQVLPALRRDLGLFLAFVDDTGFHDSIFMDGLHNPTIICNRACRQYEESGHIAIRSAMRLEEAARCLYA